MRRRIRPDGIPAHPTEHMEDQWAAGGGVKGTHTGLCRAWCGGGRAVAARRSKLQLEMDRAGVESNAAVGCSGTAPVDSNPACRSTRTGVHRRSDRPRGRLKVDEKKLGTVSLAALTASDLAGEGIGRIPQRGGGSAVAHPGMFRHDSAPTEPSMAARRVPLRLRALGDAHLRKIGRASDRRPRPRSRPSQSQDADQRLPQRHGENKPLSLGVFGPPGAGQIVRIKEFQAGAPPKTRSLNSTFRSQARR